MSAICDSRGLQSPTAARRRRSCRAWTRRRGSRMAVARLLRPVEVAVISPTFTAALHRGDRNRVGDDLRDRRDRAGTRPTSGRHLGRRCISSSPVCRVDDRSMCPYFSPYWPSEITGASGRSQGSGSRGCRPGGCGRRRSRRRSAFDPVDDLAERRVVGRSPSEGGGGCALVDEQHDDVGLAVGLVAVAELVGDAVDRGRRVAERRGSRCRPG